MNPPDQENKICFRFAVPEDAEALAEIAVTTFYEAFAVYNTEENMKMYCSSAFSKAQTETELQEKGTAFLLACQKDILIGYARLRADHTHHEPGKPDALEIERFYIRHAHTRKGVGYKLMQTCLEYARRLEYRQVWLGVWEHNTNAIAFYQACKFKCTGSHPFLLGTDLQTDLLMKLDLE